MIIRFIRVCLFACLVTVLSGAAVLVSAPSEAGAAAPGPSATTGPKCTFNGSSLPLVTGVSAGSQISVSCTGLAPLHPYMLVGTSLVLAIDPAAKPLLSGQLTSLSGLMALLTALKEIDLPSAVTPISDLFGNLKVNWTVPRFQPLDPNASCPPTQQEFNSGLLGCALAMIDLSSFKPVGAGSALFEYTGFPLLPPKPTLATSASTATPGQTVAVTDTSGVTTHWWLSTLATLESALGTIGGSPPKVTVSLVKNGVSYPAVSTAEVTPANYSGGVFTPPVLSGGFTVPTTVTGLATVEVRLTAPLDGLALSNVGRRESSSASDLGSRGPSTRVKSSAFVDSPAPWAPYGADDEIPTTSLLAPQFDGVRFPATV